MIGVMGRNNNSDNNDNNNNNKNNNNHKMFDAGTYDYLIKEHADGENFTLFSQLEPWNPFQWPERAWSRLPNPALAKPLQAVPNLPVKRPPLEAYVSSTDEAGSSSTTRSMLIVNYAFHVLNVAALPCSEVPAQSSLLRGPYS